MQSTYRINARFYGACRMRSDLCSRSSDRLYMAKIFQNQKRDALSISTWSRLVHFSKNNPSMQSHNSALLKKNTFAPKNKNLYQNILLCIFCFSPFGVFTVESRLKETWILTAFHSQLVCRNFVNITNIRALKVSNMFQEW